MEMALIVATPIEHFEFGLAPRQGKVEPEPQIVMRPKGGLELSLSRRTEHAAE